jgi:hypothetical protein
MPQEFMCPFLYPNDLQIDLAILTAAMLGVAAPFTSETPIVTLTSNGLQSRIGLTDHAWRTWWRRRGPDCLSQDPAWPTPLTGAMTLDE